MWEYFCLKTLARYFSELKADFEILRCEREASQQRSDLARLCDEIVNL